MNGERDAVAAAVERIREGGLAGERPLEGLGEAEIREVARRQGAAALPAVYGRFLGRLGRSAGDFLRGSDFLYPDLLPLKDYARELLEEDEAASALGPEHFVFLMHQGYQFLYFDATEAEDPPVYLYLEGEGEPVQVADSFSAWLETAVEEEIEEWARARNGPGIS
jgi:hypothetical protein